MKFLFSAVLAALLIGATLTGTATAAHVNWKTLPVVPKIRGAVKHSFLKDVARSRRRGMRAKVFAKIGDSNTEMAPALYGLACRRAKLNGRFRLRPVIRRYNRVRLENERAMPGCRPWTSFSRRSAAAKSGSYAIWSLTRNAELPDFPFWRAPSDCPLGETPLICEVRTLRPRYALIMTGTNDLGMAGFRRRFKVGRHITGRISALIREVRRLGSVPVVSTLPPMVTAAAPPRTINPINAGIYRSARKNRVPIINLWRALMSPRMINSGMGEGGLHLRAQPGGDSPILEPGPATFSDSVDFRPAALRFGSNRRNLIWLQTLAALDRAAGVKSRSHRPRHARREDKTHNHKRR